MLNNCDIRDTIEIYQWFDRIGNVHSNHQKEAEKVDKQTVESDTDVSVSSTKIRSRSGLQTSLHGRKEVTKDGSDLREIIMMDSGTKINMFGNPKTTTNRQNHICP